MSIGSPSDPYDVAIIGSGIAGLTAGIYTTRYVLKTLIIGDLPGGLISTVGEVENWPGTKLINGAELGKAIYEQVKDLGASLVSGRVTKIEVGQAFRILTGRDEYLAKTIILATGTERRKLGVPGEDEYFGKGVGYCVQCDKGFFKDKIVAVVGGGNSGVEGAVDFVPYAKKIYLIHRGDEFRATPVYAQSLEASDKIAKIMNTNVLEVRGDGSRVTSLRLDTPFEGSSELAVDGLFVEIGAEPGNSLAKALGVELSEQGYISTKEGQGTSLEGVFAAGDITTGSDGLQQLVCAASEGAIAARSAYRYLEKLREVVEEKKGGAAMQKPVVNKNVCIGCGLCTTVAPETFELTEGKAMVKNPDGDAQEKIQEAIDSCPVSAIGWE